MCTVERGGEPGRLSSTTHHGALARMTRMQGVANYGARFFSIVSDARVMWPGRRCAWNCWKPGLMAVESWLL
jgi:hypothetical protein